MGTAEDMDERRRDQRNLALQAAELRTPEGVMTVSVLNVSVEGAQVDAEVPPPEGTQVELAKAGVTASGHVIWVKQHRVGIRFEPPLAATSVERLVSVAPANVISVNAAA